jgi:hypothetical protein
MKKFTKEMTTYLKDGQTQRKRLELLGNEVCNLSPKDKFPHLYLFANPGIGKTHTINASMKKHSIVNYNVTGNISMFQFGVKLAVINHTTPSNIIKYITIDDCNEMLKNTENINIVKNMLADEKAYTYNKNMRTLSQSLTPLESAAVKSHTSGIGGFRVPLNNFVFIFTSNTKLPSDDEVRNERGLHLNAIYSRVMYRDYTMKPTTLWGYISDILLNTNAIPKTIPKKIKEELCWFLFDNWDSLTERSVRSAQKMIQEYTKHKIGYKVIWEQEFKK